MGFLGGLAATCTAELNSGDQTAPEFLSLGQNSATATSEREAESLLVRPEVVL